MAAEPDPRQLPGEPTAFFANPEEPATVAGEDQPIAPLPGIVGRFIGDYEILGELGRGGMGVVYKTRQNKLQRIVALKMVLAGEYASEQERSRFRAEAEAVARLQHPHIVQIHDIGAHQDRAYFSMEFCGGGSLEGKLAGRSLPPREAASLVQTLAQAMDAAHQANVVHRDLKPANVLFTADGVAKVTDFGLARKLDEAGQTRSGVVLGTPSYMAPEQARGNVKEIGPAADVYGLGAILYECLTGRPPFRAATPLDTILQVIGEAPVPPRAIQPKTPRDLEVICLKCLAKQPDRRYPSALALAEDLGRFLAGEPIEARPTTRRERVARWTRRRRAAVLLGVGALVVLALALAGVFLLGPTGDVPSPELAELPVRQVSVQQPQLKQQSTPAPAAEPVAANTIKVGILHSLTGFLAERQRSLRDAELLAVDEINARGGVLGKYLQPVVEDPAGNYHTGFPNKARKLLVEDRVAVVFGCWTSVGRKRVLPLFEEHNGLLFYPVPYEGRETSRNVVYTGGVPNQQVLPAVDWLLQNRGRTFYLLGTNYIFSRTVNAVVKERLTQKKGELVKEEYTEIGHRDYAGAVATIKQMKPAVVFSTLEGDSHAAFYQALHSAGIRPADTVVCSVTLGEEELRTMDPKTVQAHLAAWSYFQSVDTPANRDFVTKFQQKYGKERIVNDPMHSAYFQVHLWKLAVEKAGTVDVDAVREALRGLTFAAPGGEVKVDEKNQHTWLRFRLGEIQPDRSFKILHESKTWIKPEPSLPAVLP